MTLSEGFPWFPRRFLGQHETDQKKMANTQSKTQTRKTEKQKKCKNKKKVKQQKKTKHIFSVSAKAPHTASCSHLQLPDVVPPLTQTHHKTCQHQVVEINVPATISGKRHSRIIIVQTQCPLRRCNHLQNMIFLMFHAFSIITSSIAVKSKFTNTFSVPQRAGAIFLSRPKHLSLPN